MGAVGGYLRIERGSYHTSDGLKRDVGYAVLPINQKNKGDTKKVSPNFF